MGKYIARTRLLLSSVVNITVWNINLFKWH